MKKPKIYGAWVKGTYTQIKAYNKSNAVIYFKPMKINFISNEEQEKATKSRDVLNKSMLKLGFHKIEFYLGSSFFYNCVFYQTPIEDIVITDYDFKNDCAFLGGCYMAFNTKSRNYLIVTKEFIETTSLQDVLFLFKNMIC